MSSTYDAKAAKAGIRTMLTTDEAAKALNRKPQTLRKWAFTGSGPVQPVRINGRLAWPADQIAAIQSGELPEGEA